MMCDSSPCTFPSVRGETMRRFFGVFLRVIGILSLAFLLASCVIGRYYDGSKIPEEKIKEIRSGETQRKVVASWFGPPQNYVTPAIFNEFLLQMDLLSEEPLTNY